MRDLQHGEELPVLERVRAVGVVLVEQPPHLRPCEEGAHMRKVWHLRAARELRRTGGGRATHGPPSPLP